MRKYIVAAMVGLLAASPATTAFAAGSSDSDKAAHNNSEDVGKADRVICRKIETIGSRLNTQRICATAAQWSEMRQENRDGLDKVQNQRFVGNSGG